MRWYRRFFQREINEKQLDAELRFHLDQKVADLVATGMNPEEARRRGRLEFGGLDQVKEECRDVGGSHIIESLMQDLRYGVRMLGKNPGFTALAVLLLAIGTGATTAIFSVVNGVLLRRLPYPESDRLVTVEPINLKQPTINGWRTSGANFLDWRNENKVFLQLAATSWLWSFSLSGEGRPERLDGYYISGNLFATLGIQPALGRTFLPEEETVGRNHEVIISNDLWKRRYGSDPRLLGRIVKVDGEDYVVVGVAPRGLNFSLMGQRIDLYLPLAFDSKEMRKRNGIELWVLGRLKPGVTLAQAQENMSTITRQLAEQYPETNSIWAGVKVLPFNETMSYFRPAILTFFGGVTFLLLIACANIANLMLVRVMARQREFAVRAALGASRSRLVQLVVTESVLLAFFGGALGGVIGFWGLGLIRTLSPPGVIPRLEAISIDSRVFAFTGVISLLSALLFGLVPAIQCSKIDLNETLKEGGRSQSAGPFRQRTRGLLVVTEIALALTLLAGAGLLVNSFLRLLRVRPGFDPKNLLTMQISVTGPTYADPRRLVDFYETLLARVRTLPGVSAACLNSDIPFTDASMGNFFRIQARPRPAPGEEPSAESEVVAPDYFRMLGIPLIRGRYFNDGDTANATSVTIINQTLARRFFPGEDPVGKRLEIISYTANNPNNIRLSVADIVGVVGDVKKFELPEETYPAIYVPYLQNPVPDMFLVIRTAISSASVVTAVRKTMQALDKDQPVYDIKTMEARISESLEDRRFNMLLIGIFAVVALILASIGIYGVMTYLVGQRTQEIGIRMALGAERRDVLRLIVGQALQLTMVGVAVGLAGALALTRLLEDLLYGVHPTDPLTFAVVSLLLVSVALLACYVPARRATKVDPMVALRYE